MLEEVDYTCRLASNRQHYEHVDLYSQLSLHVDYMYNVIHFPLLWSFNFKSRPHTFCTRIITMAE